MKLSTSEHLELLSKLTLEHQTIKDRVRTLEQQTFRTSTEQLEISQLKKKKLLMKDRIQILLQN